MKRLVPFCGALGAVIALAAHVGALAGQPRNVVVADLVLRGGKVITVDQQNRIASAVAVVGNRIAAVGTDQEIGQMVGARTQIVDLKGRALLPGFIDSHSHVEGLATSEHFLVPVQAPPLKDAN